MGSVLAAGRGTIAAAAAGLDIFSRQLIGIVGSVALDMPSHVVIPEQVCSVMDILDPLDGVDVLPHLDNLVNKLITDELRKAGEHLHAEGVGHQVLLQFWHLDSLAHLKLGHKGRGP
jgi:hypothetical protein